jgi:hypothetical protein
MVFHKCIELVGFNLVVSPMAQHDLHVINKSTVISPLYNAAKLLFSPAF